MEPKEGHCDGFLNMYRAGIAKSETYGCIKDASSLPGPPFVGGTEGDKECFSGATKHGSVF